MKSVARNLVIACFLMSCALVIACGSERAPLPGTGEGAEDTRLPAGEPPVAEEGLVDQGMAASEAAPTEDDGTPPLKATGIGSREEMDRALARLDKGGPKKIFEQGFRGCFTSDRSQRDYAGAKQRMETLLVTVPDFPPAYRVLAYATFNIGFDMEGATQWYEKAVEVDPDYGEAHYALSFMLTQFDSERGRMHFEKAVELGIPDERNLEGQFYPKAAGS